jgi:23S rRNA pseudouridine2605 synthase
MRLRRVALGPLRLGEVPTGAYRPLTGAEVRELWQTTTPEARRAREDAQRAQAARKAAARAAGVTGEKTDAAGEKSATPSTPSHTQGPTQHGKRRDERPTKRDADGKRLGGDRKHPLDPEPFRLPRGPALSDDAVSRRPVIIGGDSSSFGPRKTKTTKQAVTDRPSQRSRPPKIGVATPPSEDFEPDEQLGEEAVGGKPATARPHRSGQKPSGRARGVGRQKKSVARGGARGGKAGNARRVGVTKKTGRVKRRGAGRGESA